MSQPIVLDLLGIGFGPAGMALGAAIEDSIEAGAAIAPEKIRFLERNPSPSWHSSMMLPGTIINHNHLRDIVTPRNPRSRFTFVCYLHEKNRLFEFGHLGGTVSRAEWADYICWVGKQLSHMADYDQEVETLRYLPRENGQGLIEITTKRSVFHTSKLVLATGGKPNIPELFQPHVSETVFHTRNLLPKLSQLCPEKAQSFMVLGSGQSAIETIIHLHGKYPNAIIHSVHRMVGFRIKESGHTSNVIYFPEETNYFHSLSPSNRKVMLENTTSADYGNVNNATSEILFKLMYEDKVNDRVRVIMHNRREVMGVEKAGSSYQIQLKDIFQDTTTQIESNVCILGTGYFEESVPSILSPLTEHLVIDKSAGDSLAVDRDYRVETHPGFDPSIYLCGMSEKTHGISDTQSFSLMATKAGTILQGLALEAE